MSETTRKLAHLLPHWIEHNQAHLVTYQTWQERAQREGVSEVAQCLEAPFTLLQGLCSPLDGLLQGSVPDENRQGHTGNGRQNENSAPHDIEQGI